MLCDLYVLLCAVGDFGFCMSNSVHSMIPVVLGKLFLNDKGIYFLIFCLDGTLMHGLKTVLQIDPCYDGLRDSRL